MMIASSSGSNRGVDLRRRQRRRELVLVEELGGTLRDERHLSGGELVEDDAAGIDVAPCIELVRAALLRRHVLGGAGDDAVLLCRQGALERDTEVADLHDHGRASVVVVARHEDQVLRLDVAMDNPARVRVRQARAHLHHHGGEPRPGQLALHVEHAPELGAVEVLHREVELAVRLLSEVDDARDVRVIEAARRERFGIEAAAEVDVALERLVEDLHRDRHH